MLKSTPAICCLSIYGKISIVQLKTCPEVSVTYVLCILARCELYSGCYQLFSPLSFEASGVDDFLLLMVTFHMTFKSSTASIDYVLVSRLEYILDFPLLYPLLFFFVFLCCLFFTLPFVDLHSCVCCVFLLIFFSCENKSSSQKEMLSKCRNIL